MDLYLVRHGLSVGNRARGLQGWADSGLSAAGYAQAAATGRRLAQVFAARGTRPAGLYSSDTPRAWETALVIGQALRLAPVPDPGLREMHFGVAEDTSPELWRAAYPDLLPRWRDRTDLDFGWPEGETRRDLRARVTATLVAITARHHPGDQVVAITHGGPIRGYLAHAVTRLPALADADLTRDVGNCSITHVHFDADGDVLGVGCLWAWDQGDHLDPAAED
jgi:broad specificity phosphatase PhoE